MIYDPAEDSYLLSKIIQKSVRNKSFLDIGSGSGIQSEFALKSGAKKVLAIDVEDEVIIYLQNKFKSNKKIKIKKSNLFSSIKKSEKFDIIAFNPPYLPEDKREDSESGRITSGGKKGDEIIIKFIRKAQVHLNKNGVILIVVSSLTPNRRIENLIKKLNLVKEMVAEEKIFFEKLEVWKIKEK